MKVTIMVNKKNSKTDFFILIPLQKLVGNDCFNLELSSMDLHKTQKRNQFETAY